MMKMQPMLSMSEVATVLMKTRISQLISSIQTNTSQSMRDLVDEFDSFINLLNCLSSHAFASLSEDNEYVYERVFMAQIFTSVGLKERPIELLEEVLVKLNKHLVGSKMITNRLRMAIEHSNGKGINTEQDIGDLDKIPKAALYCILKHVCEG